MTKLQARKKTAVQLNTKKRIKPGKIYMACLSWRFFSDQPVAAIWLMVLAINGINLYFCYKLWRYQKRRTGYKIELVLLPELSKGTQRSFLFEKMIF